MFEPSPLSSQRHQSERTWWISYPTLIGIVIGILVIVAALAFFAGYSVANANNADQRAQYGIFQEAWGYLEREFYYSPPPQEERIRGAVQGMVGTLGDRYTVLLDPPRAAADTAIMSGESGGIGAKVTTDDAGNVVIAEVGIGKPAEKAGILSGDIIIAVDGKSVRGQAGGDVVGKVRGPIGSKVRITVLRSDQELTFEIVRQQINVFYKLLDHNIGYVSLSIFDSKAADQVQEALETLKKQGATTLIFDLRSNPGGYLDQAVKVADLFLDEGLVAREKVKRGNSRTFRSKSGDVAETIPLYVLIDRNSASASEIVAGAFRDRNRAILIGQTSFGKGSIQSLHKLSDGSQLRITSGAWYTPNDLPIQDKGLPVNLWVTLPEIFPPGVDPVLNAAVKYILNGGPAAF
jgi:carboxyl-terminal processing protease